MPRLMNMVASSAFQFTPWRFVSRNALAAGECKENTRTGALPCADTPQSFNTPLSGYG